MKNLLKKAKAIIANQIEEEGFIEHSNGTINFLDNLSEKLAKHKILKNTNIYFYDWTKEFCYDKKEKIEKLQKKLLYIIEQKIMCNYHTFGIVEKNHYRFFYFKVNKTFKTLDGFNKYFKIEK